jgi:hypothetical protein
VRLRNDAHAAVLAWPCGRDAAPSAAAVNQEQRDTRGAQGVMTSHDAPSQPEAPPTPRAERPPLVDAAKAEGERKIPAVAAGEGARMGRRCVAVGDRPTASAAGPLHLPRRNRPRRPRRAAQWPGAAPADIRRRPWKRKWPHYVRVHGAEFIAGPLANGVALTDLMDELGSNAFASTQANARLELGNTNPRASLRQQPVCPAVAGGALLVG